MFDVNDDGLIDFREFTELNKRFPLILYPAFRLQESMQKLTLGQRAWSDIFENLHRSRTDRVTIRKTLGMKLKALFRFNKVATMHALDSDKVMNADYKTYKDIVEKDFELNRKRVVQSKRLSRQNTINPTASS